MDSRNSRKDEQVRRHLKGMKRAKTHADRKELERRSRERKADQTARRPRRKGRWIGAELEANEELDFPEEQEREYERMARAPRFRASAERRRALEAVVRGPSAEEDEGPPRAAAIVLSCAPGRALVDQNGRERDAVLADRIARGQRTLLAVGDEVELVERAGAEPRIVRVLPRRSRISRPDPARPDVERVLAANVDVAVVVVSLRQPAFRPRLIDRYLIAVQRGGVEPVVCANKCDLVPAEERARVEEELAPYRAIDVPTLLTSGVSGEGIESLRAMLLGRTVVFLGQSGVGKSSLLNALAPELELATGAVRRGDGKGRHTTTRSSLRDLGGGTRWIDTPGIRSFGLADVTPATLAAYFPELEEPRRGCRFADCRHAEEPDCGVRAAVEDGRVPAARYGTYLRILRSLRE